MKDFLKNKVAIVTGSTSGIGKATAIELAKLGAHVVINGRNTERLQKTYYELKKKGFSITAVQGDVTVMNDCETLIKKAVEHFGRIDILIANASITMCETFENFHHDSFRAVLESNSIGPAFSIKAALPEIKKNKGSIVFISSVAGFVGTPTASAYSAGKMAMTALAESLKIEMEGTGIHIGIVYTWFTENESTKMVLKSDGALFPVKKRPFFIQQSREHVAKEIIKNIRNKKFKTTLSAFGKISLFMLKFFPALSRFIIAKSYKKFQGEK